MVEKYFSGSPRFAIAGKLSAVQLCQLRGPSSSPFESATKEIVKKAMVESLL
jgi:hypothetical protein